MLEHQPCIEIHGIQFLKLNYLSIWVLYHEIVVIDVQIHKSVSGIGAWTWHLGLHRL
jgi:hypothetical protein